MAVNANGSKRGYREEQQIQGKQDTYTSRVCENVSDTQSSELQRAWGAARGRWAKPGCGMRWPAEPDVGRVAHGIPNRVDRIKCLGNAVVPQQFYPIFRAISIVMEEESDA